MSLLTSNEYVGRLELENVEDRTQSVASAAVTIFDATAAWPWEWEWLSVHGYRSLVARRTQNADSRTGEDGTWQAERGARGNAERHERRTQGKRRRSPECAGRFVPFLEVSVCVTVTVRKAIAVASGRFNLSVVFRLGLRSVGHSD
ncbi:hypothetical protein BDN71DRAFT_1511519 [Pleurotus eryngii]|uniref:Uncharacterized protein n=1 Tax=Pleurotus eryngii TaxID=5323 RepID=A0A9P5ZLA7_PLEER|nr:hypothetical protein BDN71DRAFT_1511519 [Pleurotus eryngii]